MLVAIVLAAGPAAAWAVPIADLHQNDMNGVPAAPYTIGTPVAISGIVTARIDDVTIIAGSWPAQSRRQTATTR